jgi:hypothetical protein
MVLEITPFLEERLVLFYMEDEAESSTNTRDFS